MPPATRRLSRQQIYRRRRIAVFSGMALMLAVAFYLPVTLLAPLRTVDAAIIPYPTPAVTQPEVLLPEYGAAAVGAVGYPGVLVSAGSAEALPIASITKSITALVVLDAHPLAPGEAGPELVFGSADVGYFYDMLALDGLVEDVYSGMVMSQRDVLNVMLLTSANNYAMSLAAWAFGSIEAYVAAAGQWLTAHGLTASTVTEPTGIRPDNVSTASDLVELARIINAHPVMAEIVATPVMEVAGLGVIHNTNQLLGVAGIDGIKTGTLEEAGACLLFSWDLPVGEHSVTLVGVVLGGPDHATIDAAIAQLVAEVGSGFTDTVLVTQGEPFASYRTPWGDQAQAVAAETVSIPRWGATPVLATIHAENLTVAGAGTPVGSVVFEVAPQTITVPLVLESEIADPGPWWRLGNPGELF